MRISATALYLTGKAEGLEGDTKIYGGGAGGIYRNAFKDILAFDIELTLVTASGQVADDVDMSVWLGTIPLDLEFLLVNNEKIAVIGFIGFSFTYNSISIDSKVPGNKFTFDMTTSMKGPQGGIQVSFKLGDFTLSPFLMLTKQSGDVDIGYDISGLGSGSTSMSVSSGTIKYFGLDIIYVPLGLTLSSLIQQASMEKNDYQTYVISIGYSPRL
ncbi:MAG: hypothetical protein ACUVRK_00495 [Spirochaetota bacterium]